MIRKKSFRKLANALKTFPVLTVNTLSRLLISCYSNSENN